MTEFLAIALPGIGFVLTEIGLGDLLAADADNPAGHADDGRVRRHLFEHDGARADLGAFPHGKPAQNFGARGHGDVFHEGGVPLAPLLARAAERRPLIDDDARMHFRRLPDDDAAAVVDEHTGINPGGGVDLDARQKSGNLADDARQKFEVHPVQPIGKPMMGQGMHPRIGEKNFKFVPCGGVVFLGGGNVRAQS